MNAIMALKETERIPKPELTWKDIMITCEHYVDVNYEYEYHSIQEKYEEILRRFKEEAKNDQD